jgi:hypothetical protein
VSGPAVRRRWRGTRGRAPLRALTAALTVAAVVVAVSVGRAAPAAADPPVPTDYRSTVDGIDPASDGVRAEIVGGDAFLELRVGEGHEVVVEGYQGEPYLRFRPDGTVERNLRSPATYVNESRDGAVDLPGGVDAETAETAEPDWQPVADGGTYAWHDHRVHWMGSERPAGAEPGDWTRPWDVDLVVDGTETRITGTLALVEGVSPLPWAALALAGGVAAALVGRRRPVVTAAAAALVAGALALAVGWAQYDAAPGGAGANRLLVVVPALGLVAGALGLGFALRSAGGDARLARGRPERATVAAVATTATLAGAAAAAGWCVLRLEVLWRPVLPTELTYGLDRAGTAVALGFAVAAAGLVVWGSGRSVLGEARAAAIAEGGDRR